MTGSLNMIGYGLAAIGPGVGIGLIFAAYITGVARQPEAQGRLQTIAILGFALAEALAIIGIALAFVLTDADPPLIEVTAMETDLPRGRNEPTEGGHAETRSSRAGRVRPVARGLRPARCLIWKYVVPRSRRPSRSARRRSRVASPRPRPSRPRPTPARRARAAARPTPGTRPRASVRRRVSRAPLIVAEMREQAQAEASRISSTARRRSRPSAAGGQQLRAEVGTLATALAGRIVGESLEDDARQSRVVERFIDDLESRPPAARGDGASTEALRGACA